MTGDVVAETADPLERFAEGVATFAAVEHDAEAVQPRRHDVPAKVKEPAMPPVAHIMVFATRCRGAAP